MEEVCATCPYCFETVTLFIEEDVSGHFVQDCEVCCRPWAVFVQRRGGRTGFQVERAQ